jgi:hypothetical protein
MGKTSIITVQDIPISISVENNKDYICLTDMIKAKDGEFFISDWLRNKDTIEYVGTWESLYNPNFNYGEFTIIKNEAGSRAYRISVKDWVEQTNAIGIMAKSGRYGGTYAYKDIAFNFGMWTNLPAMPICGKSGKVNFLVWMPLMQKKVLEQLNLYKIQ